MVRPGRALVVGRAPVEVLGAVERDDVDHAEERVRAVERRRRTAKNLDPLDGLDGDELGAEEAEAHGPERHRLAVDQDLDGIVRGLELPEDAADADVLVGVVVDERHAGDGPQGVRDAAVAAARDLPAGDDRDDGGRLLGPLGVFGGGHHLAQQLLQVQLAVVGRLAGRLAGGSLRLDRSGRSFSAPDGPFRRRRQGRAQQREDNGQPRPDSAAVTHRWCTP